MIKFSYFSRKKFFIPLVLPTLYLYNSKMDLVSEFEAHHSISHEMSHDILPFLSQDISISITYIKKE